MTTCIETLSDNDLQDLQKRVDAERRKRWSASARAQMERSGLAKPGESYCSEQENACEQDEGA